MNKQQLAAAALLLGLSSAAVANDTEVDENSLFGNSDTDTQDSMFGTESDTDDDLFGQGLLSESDGEGLDLAQQMLAGNDVFSLNGDLTLAATTSRKDYARTGVMSDEQMQAYGTVTMDVRPSANLRGLVKGDYTLDQDASDTSLREVLVDWTLADQWYLRAGKQVMHWGVGYFYSPADLISSDSIDAADPEADRTGTEAVKLHYPTGNDNYYAYLVPQTGSSNNAVGAKGEWLLNEAELSLAGVSRPSGHNSMAMTYYLPASDVNMFVEYALHHGVDSSLHTSSDWVSQSTLGASYSFKDDDDYAITLRGQYYDDGLEAEQRGALSLHWSSMYQSDYTMSLSSLANFSDGSALQKASLRYTYSDDVKATLSYSSASGTSGAEYSSFGSGNAVSLKVTLLSREY